MKKTNTMAMLIALTAAAMSPMSLAAALSRTTGSRRRIKKAVKPASYYKPNGERERNRRMHQMMRDNNNRRARLIRTAGSLTREASHWGLSRRMRPVGFNLVDY